MFKIVSFVFIATSLKHSIIFREGKILEESEITHGYIPFQRILGYGQCRRERSLCMYLVIDNFVLMQLLILHPCVFFYLSHINEQTTRHSFWIGRHYRVDLVRDIWVTNGYVKYVERVLNNANVIALQHKCAAETVAITRLRKQKKII